MEKKEKCPKCGEWCEPEKRGFFKRGLEGSGKASDIGKKIGGSIGGVLGDRGRKIGGLLGEALVGTSTIASAAGAFEAFSGDEYIYKCPYCGYEWTASSEDVEIDEVDMDEQWGDILEKYGQACNNETDWNKKLSIWQEALSEFDEDDWPTGRVYYWIAQCYYVLKDYQSAVDSTFKGLSCKGVEYGGVLYGDLCYLLYSILVNSEDYDLSSARKYALLASKFANDDIEGQNKLTKRRDAINDFYELDKKYTDNFLKLPYKDRKTLLVVDVYEDLDQDHFVTLNINSLSNLSFPMGHPKVNEMYVAHPMATNRYMPIENYQLELIEDRVREFCELAQHLGATEINIECLNSNDNDSTNSGSRNISGGASKSSVGGSIGGHDEYSRRLMEKISRSVSLHQTFHPHKTPELPNSLIWYNGEPSWQRLYRQRMEGSLLTHEERIETSKSQVVDNREMKAIKAELKTLYINMNMEFDKTEESKFEQQENAVLAISVKFAPLSELTGSSATQSSQNVGLSANERKYIEEVKECLADGEIGKTARKLLNMTREQLGISEARAAELETFVAAPQLTEEENEYLETYREACTDGKISDGERRMLDRYRSKLGISESRAKEIERMA